jgi:nicotinamidase-related amidase
LSTKLSFPLGKFDGTNHQINKMEKNKMAGLEALLTPDNCVLILIDHQPFQFAGLQSHEPQLVINNVVSLAKTAKVYGVPTLLTTVVEERGGYIIKQLQDVFPDQKPINRTFINTWEDTRVVDWVKATGKKKIVMAALWTEICLAFPAIQAAGEGYEVYAVTDASGGVSWEAHEMAVRRMVTAGVVPITSGVFGAELQRDWAREETVPALAQIVVEHSGSVGTSFIWEQQLLNTPVPSK